MTVIWFQPNKVEKTMDEAQSEMEILARTDSTIMKAEKISRTLELKRFSRNSGTV